VRLGRHRLAAFRTESSVGLPFHAATAIVLVAFPATGAILGGATLRRWRARLLATSLVARDTALAAGVARLFTRPLMRGALLVGSFPSLARNLTLLGPIHRSKPAIFLGHVALLSGEAGSPVLICNGYAL